MDHRMRYVRGMRKNLFEETDEFPHSSALLFARQQYMDVCAATFINGRGALKLRDFYNYKGHLGG